MLANSPDNATSFLKAETSASVSISDIAGLSVSTRITWFSPAIQATDRTIRAEINLFNGGPSEMKRFEQLVKDDRSQHSFKHGESHLPTAAFEGDEWHVTSIVPGMNTSVKLAIGGNDDAYVVPSRVVNTRSGTKYVLAVEDGSTKEVLLRCMSTTAEGRGFHW